MIETRSIERTLSQIFYTVSCLALASAPRAAEACAVCSTGREDANRTAFLVTAAFLSVLPLAMIGGLVIYIRRRTRALEARGRDAAADGALARP